MATYRIDLTGKRFGRLVVISFAGKEKGNHSKWLCRCDCGTEKVISGNHLPSGHTTSCGCSHFGRQDLTGKVFTHLTVIKSVEYKSKGSFWVCKCVCGNEAIVSAGNLNSGGTKSCGCRRKDNVLKHGFSRTREYIIWLGIKRRCTNPHNRAYKYYKTIKIYEPWLNSYEEFIKDVGYAPSNKHSIDRIDNNGDYAPGNVRWATSKQQGNNKRNTVYVTYKGDKVPVSELAEKVGMKRGALCYMVFKKGLSPEDAIKFYTQTSQVHL